MSVRQTVEGAETPSEDLWERILAAARPRVDRHTFETWFLPTKQERIEQDVLVVRVPSQLFSKRLSEKHRGVLQTALAEVGHPGMTLKYIWAETAYGVPPAEPTQSNLRTPWDSAETMEFFLQSGEEEAVFLDVEKRIVARSCVTEIFAPRGLGKSLFAIHLAVYCSRRGLRVFLIDRDNPRHVVRKRLASFGVTPELQTLRVLARDQCPPLTDSAAWARFPYQNYDLVIVDSLDSAAEGVGEQDSSRPSRALAPLLNIARHENGPAVLILGNTIKSAKHSRGSGVIEDRADIVYEVRDATGFRATGTRPWVEELPAGEASKWASRASRRERRDRYRLAFVASKFRIGEEPEPFILEIDLSQEPWTVVDVTGEVDRVGKEASNRRVREKAARLDVAAKNLATEIRRRSAAGEAALRKRQDAEPFLQAAGLRRSEARDLLRDRDGKDWILLVNPNDQRITYVLPPLKKGDVGHDSTVWEPAQTLGGHKTECGQAHSTGVAAFDHVEMPINTGDFNTADVAVDTFSSPIGNEDQLPLDVLDDIEEEAI